MEILENGHIQQASRVHPVPVILRAAQSSGSDSQHPISLICGSCKMPRSSQIASLSPQDLYAFGLLANRYCTNGLESVGLLPGSICSKNQPDCVNAYGRGKVNTPKSPCSKSGARSDLSTMRCVHGSPLASHWRSFNSQQPGFQARLQPSQHLCAEGIF